MAAPVVYEKVQDVGIIRFCFNEINLQEREDIKKELKSFISSGDTKFVIDLSKVGFLSSLALALIVFFAKEVKALGGSIKLCGLSSEALGVFQVTQLDKVFEIYDKEQDALKSFG